MRRARAQRVRACERRWTMRDAGVRRSPARLGRSSAGVRTSSAGFRRSSSGIRRRSARSRTCSARLRSRPAGLRRSSAGLRRRCTPPHARVGPRNTPQGRMDHRRVLRATSGVMEFFRFGPLPARPVPWSERPVLLDDPSVGSSATTPGTRKPAAHPIRDCPTWTPRAPRVRTARRRLTRSLRPAGPPSRRRP